MTSTSQPDKWPNPWHPCPLCGVDLLAEGDGMEHPASDLCPLDSLWLRPDHRAAWNIRAARPARKATPNAP